jgi:nucleoside 2-deoxyribosyltransferase
MKLYIAGPDVFRPDAMAWADDVRRLCADAGHQALLPLDNVETAAPGIYLANIALIREADAVLANLNPFRGDEPDSGTCFEVGFAIALGKPVVGYLADIRPQLGKMQDRHGDAVSHADGRWFDAQAMAIENFDLPVNLMLGCSCRIIQGALADALAAAGG